MFAENVLFIIPPLNSSDVPIYNWLFGASYRIQLNRIWIYLMWLLMCKLISAGN